MSILFSSDYHLGVNRLSHTTVDSRKRLKAAVYAAALEASQQIGGCFRVCAGDLFDTFRNEEEDIFMGATVFRTLDLCLAGNHDMSNDLHKMGSLELLAETSILSTTELVSTKVGAPRVEVVATKSADIYAVPHHATQAEFTTALESAYDRAQEAADTRYRILLLHCNYNQTEVMLNETTLNLSEEDAEVLLEVFDHIVMGHEHTPAEYFGGRLWVVGNTFPTSFSDISDKRVLQFDDGKMTSHKIWDASTGYTELHADLLLSSDNLVLGDEVQFARVTGPISPEQVKELSSKLRQVWKDNPNLLLLGNFTTILRQVSESALDFEGEDSFIPLPDRVDTALKGGPLYGMWSEIYENLKEKGDV